MLWTGENIGLGTYNHLLAASPDGTVFRASLALGAKSALACWPLLTSAVILLSEYGGRRPAEAAEPAAGPAAGPVDPTTGPVGGHSP